MKIQGVTRKPYESMVAAFGEPTTTDSMLEWDVTFEDGSVAKIKSVDSPVKGVYTIEGDSRDAFLEVKKKLKGTIK